MHSIEDYLKMLPPGTSIKEKNENTTPHKLTSINNKRKYNKTIKSKSPIKKLCLTSVNPLISNNNINIIDTCDKLDTSELSNLPNYNYVSTQLDKKIENTQHFNYNKFTCINHGENFPITSTPNVGKKATPTLQNYENDDDMFSMNIIDNEETFCDLVEPHQVDTDYQKELFDYDYELEEGLIEINNNIPEETEIRTKTPQVAENNVLEEIKIHLKALNKIVAEMQVQIQYNSTILKKIHKTLNLDEEDIINFKIPAETMENLNDIEEKCNSDNIFCRKLIIHLSKFKKGNNKCRNILKYLVKDTVLLNFNWDGRNNKKDMKSMTVFNKVLREACGIGFEEEIRSAVTLAKNLTYHKKKLT